MGVITPLAVRLVISSPSGALRPLATIRISCLRGMCSQLDAPQVWCKAEINGIEVETASQPFDAFGDDAPICRLVI